jgi:hypothetical protein
VACRTVSRGGLGVDPGAQGRRTPSRSRQTNIGRAARSPGGRRPRKPPPIRERSASERVRPERRRDRDRLGGLLPEYELAA